MTPFDIFALVAVVIIGCGVCMLAHASAVLYHELSEYRKMKKVDR
jgi:hypothetical protein